MFPLAINGLGPVGSFGAGIDNFREALTGNIEVTPEINLIRTRTGNFELPVFRAGTTSLTEFIKPRKLRRLDNFSRMALLGSALAVKDSEITLDGNRTGLIIASAHGASATTFAFLDSVLDDGDALASPTLFSNSVHNAAASHIAEHFAITGPTLSLAQGADSLTMALLTAGQWLDKGEIDTVLCGIIDCYCDVLGYCWQQCREKSNSPRPVPTSGPGEGALFLRLGRMPKDSRKPKYGYIKQIELNLDTPPPNLPFICTSPNSQPHLCSGSNGNETFTCRNRIDLDLKSITGELPVPTCFDLAAAAVINGNFTPANQIIQEKGFASVPPALSTICCWQPCTGQQRKPLTGNAYWITNHPE